MKCKQFQILISEYMDHEIPQQQPYIENHLTICQACQNYHHDIQRIKKMCRETSSPQPSDLDWKKFSDAVANKLCTIQKPKTYSHFYLYPSFRYAVSFSLMICVAVCWLTIDLHSGYSFDEENKNLQNSFIRINQARAVREVGQNNITHENIKISANCISPLLNMTLNNPSDEQIQGLLKNTIQNYSQIQTLSHKELEFLYKNGFVVTSKQFNSFVDLYRDNHKNNIPSFVSVDTAILGFSHVLARLRVDLEKEIFAKRLTEFTKILREQLLVLHHQIPENCKPASFQILACIKVASQLLNCDDDNWPANILQEIQIPVEKELALIYNTNSTEVGIQKSNIFDYDIDYNKFKTRFDETQSDELRRYYLAMEWYSRCIFRTGNPTDGFKETQSALLLLMAAIANPGDAIIIWDEMNLLMTALYGELDDPHLIDYHTSAREVFGDRIIPNILNDFDRLNKFCRNVENKKAPRIRSEVGLRGGLRIFGGRYYQRDAILQELCYPYVSDPSDPRIIPSLLDIAIILGSPKGDEIARERDYYRFKEYRTKIEGYRAKYKNIPEHVKPWQNGGILNEAWMYSPLIGEEEKNKKYPSFCTSSLWQDRKLSSVLCGIIHLSNSKPTFIGADIAEFSAIVDPYPEFFNRLLTNIKYIEKLLEMTGYPMNRDAGRELIRYKNSIQQVVSISQSMLSGQILGEEAQRKLGNFVLGWKGDYEEANVSELSTLFHRNHTNYDSYFHAGIEAAREIWVLHTNPNSKTFVARGALHLLYEFTTGYKVLPNDWRKGELWKVLKENKGTKEVTPWSESFAD